MVSKSMEEIITCNVCYELFNYNNRCPRMISCGHTFCHSCLEKILLNDPCPSCPTCKTHIQSQIADSVPINFSINGLISETENNSLPTGSSRLISAKLESEGFCDEHSNFKELRCMDCKSWICGICSTLKHKHCRILLVKQAYKEIKDRFSQKVKEEVDHRKLIKDVVTQSLISLEREKKKLSEEIKKKESDLKVCEARIQELKSVKSEGNQFCDNVQQLHNSFENSLDNRKYSEGVSKELETLLALGKINLMQIKSRLLKGICHETPATLEELKILSDSQPVYVVETEDRFLYGMVKIFDDQIFIYSFRPDKPTGYLFPFKEFLSRFDQFRDFPKTGFLKVIPRGGGNADAVNVVIETDGLSPRAKNFTYICSSLKGQTYKGRTLEFDGGSSLCSLSSGPPPVVEGICRIDGKGRWKSGLVAGMWKENSGFSIVLSNYVGHSDPQIGFVLFGLPKLKALQGQILLIKDCGLVI